MKKPSFKINDRVVVQSNNYNNCGISKGDIGTIKSFMCGLKGVYARVSMDTTDCPTLSWEHNMWYIRLEDVIHETPPTYWDTSQNKEVEYQNSQELILGQPREFFEYYTKQLDDLSDRSDFDGNSINTHENTECIHEPMIYQGFTESYHFCKKCDKRLD